MHPQARLDQFFTLSRPEIKDSDKFDPKAKKKAGAKAKPGAKKAKQDSSFDIRIFLLIIAHNDLCDEFCSSSLLVGSRNYHVFKEDCMKKPVSYVLEGS